MSLDTTRYASYPSLRDRVVFVSGGASGLGAEFVQHFAHQGARVGFVDIQEEAGRALAESVKEQGLGDPLFEEVDVEDVEALQRAIALTGEKLGPITVLVNNAANDQRQDVHQLTVGAWEQGIKCNLTHHFFSSQAVAPMMRSAGGGSIINMGSISAHIDLTSLPVYITAKAAIEGLTRTLARELGPDKIRVNCVIPGWVMTERQLANWVTPEAVALIERSQCLADKVLPPDVARLVLWLAAEDSRACTAQRWIVDGGWM